LTLLRLLSVRERLFQEDSNRFRAHVRAGRVEVGRHTFGEPTVVFFRGDTCKVRIGAFSGISSNAEIMPGGIHRLDWVSTFPFRALWGLPGAFEDGNPFSKGDVEIGNDVYIGRKACILSGVRIGDGAVVGAHSVISRDVPPYAIAAGAPARVVRYRFCEQQREALLRIAWWTWSDEEILDHVDALNGMSVEEFIARYDPQPDGAAGA
jgi:acetyltransferase-like isoleucine patch superfamily enzyme